MISERRPPLGDHDAPSGTGERPALALAQRPRLLLGDCREILATLEAESVDAIVCDPPYELGFMGKGWDRSGVAFDAATWAACLRVAKPGAHLVAFGGTRTAHRLAVAIEDAGWEIRDTIAWCYWSGFPKSLDISKDMDRAAGAAREVVATPMGRTGNKYAKGLGDPRPWMSKAAEAGYHEHPGPTPATDLARQWNGWGTAIKPAFEPAILARKPLRETSIARQVMATGTGALNIDACRFAPGDPMWPGPDDGEYTYTAARPPSPNATSYELSAAPAQQSAGQRIGRFPSNLIHVPKASREERELGCEGLPVRTGAEAVDREEGQSLDSPSAGAGRTADGVRNWHPTVKPLHLMRWLVRLVTPPGGVVLDPFMGSGTTGMAAVGQGFRFVGCELDADHLQISRARVEWASVHGVECDLGDVRQQVQQASLFGSVSP